MLNARKALGNAGEAIACRFLQSHGFRVVAQNWRHKQLELDIIAKHGDTLVFVEVKTRTKGGMSSPIEAVTPRKQATCIRAARAYLAAFNLWHCPCRFDIVCVELLPSQPAAPFNGAHTICRDGATFSVEHYPHAFELSSALDSGNAAWQPW